MPATASAKPRTTMPGPIVAMSAVAATAATVSHTKNGFFSAGGGGGAPRPRGRRATRAHERGGRRRRPGGGMTQSVAVRYYPGVRRGRLALRELERLVRRDAIDT